MGSVRSLAHRVEYARAVLLGLVAGSLFRQGEMKIAAREYRTSTLGMLAGCVESCMACELPQCHTIARYDEVVSAEQDARSQLRALRVYERYLTKRLQSRWLAKRGKVTLRSTVTAYERRLFDDALKHAEAHAWR
jgi:hypothetical protein